jgi:hypothetical protein
MIFCVYTGFNAAFNRGEWKTNEISLAKGMVIVDRNKPGLYLIQNIFCGISCVSICVQFGSRTSSHDS